MGSDKDLFWQRWCNGLLETQSQRQGDIIMDSKIEWETDMDTAVARARSENKLVLLDFFNPG